MFEIELNFSGPDGVEHGRVAIEKAVPAVELRWRGRVLLSLNEIVAHRVLDSPSFKIRGLPRAR